MLLFGRPPCLLVDLMFHVKPLCGFRSYPQFVKKWRNVRGQKIASETVQWNAQHGKKLYDKKVHRIVLEPGVRVLV